MLLCSPKCSMMDHLCSKKFLPRFYSFPTIFFPPSRVVAIQHASATLKVSLIPSSLGPPPSCDGANKNVITPSGSSQSALCMTAPVQMVECTSSFNYRLMLFLRATCHLADRTHNTLVIRSTGRCNEPVLELAGWWQASTISLFHICWHFFVHMQYSQWLQNELSESVFQKDLLLIIGCEIEKGQEGFRRPSSSSGPETFCFWILYILQTLKCTFVHDYFSNNHTCHSSDGWKSTSLAEIKIQC